MANSDAIPAGAAERLQSALDAPYISIRTATGYVPNSVRVFRADLRALLDEREQWCDRMADADEGARGTLTLASSIAEDRNLKVDELAAATARAEQAEAKLVHFESVVEAFHAEADRLSDLLDAARNNVQRYRTGYERLRARLVELGEAETQQRIVTPGGRIYTPTERDLAMRADWLDGVRLEQRTVYPTPWVPADDATARDTGYATGGTISADTPPPALNDGCVRPTRSLEQLAAEQGVQPVISIHDLTAAPEDRPSDEEIEAFLSALREVRGTELDDLDILLAALMCRLGDEVELSQDEIEDARRRLRDEEWHFVAFRASFLAPDLVTVKMRSRPRAGKSTTDHKEPAS